MQASSNDRNNIRNHSWILNFDKVTYLVNSLHCKIKCHEFTDWSKASLQAKTKQANIYINYNCIGIVNSFRWMHRFCITWNIMKNIQSLYLPWQHQLQFQQTPSEISRLWLAKHMYTCTVSAYSSWLMNKHIVNIADVPHWWVCLSLSCHQTSSTVLDSPANTITV